MGKVSLIIVLLVLFCSVVEAKDRALLVGISEYKDKRANLVGPKEDVQDMEKFLIGNLKFAKTDIKMLLNEQATREEIIKAFRRWLIEETRPGDRVFFLYSGHGSRLRDDNGDEKDGIDETIVPYDVDTRTGAGQIRDDVFEELIRELSGRRAVLVFDSCHSGTISRGGGGNSSQNNQKNFTRYLPSPEEFEEFAKTSNTRGGIVGDYQILPDKKAISRDLVPEFGDEHSNNLVGIVVFSAAQTGQLAHSFMTEKGFRGALTYTFIKLQENNLLTLSELRKNIVNQIKELQKTEKLKGEQQPMVECISTLSLEEFPLFGIGQQTPIIEQAVEFATLTNDKSKIKISVLTREKKASYKLGEYVSYQVTTDTSGYLYMIIFSSQDQAVCLLPNPHDLDNGIDAGKVEFPRGGKYKFEVSEPLGYDIVVALVSKEKLNFGEKEIYTWQEAFSRLNIKELQKAVETTNQNLPRSNKVVPVKKYTDWQAAIIVVRSYK